MCKALDNFMAKIKATCAGKKPPHDSKDIKNEEQVAEKPQPSPAYNVSDV